MANKPQPSKLADSYQTYPTASAAAVAALRSIDNKQYERGGGILYNKEQNVYAATDPVGQSDGSHFAAAVGVPPGWQLHSTYHTHPSGARSTQFSDDDINTAQQLKAPSYVLARDDNKIRMFDPASSKVQKDSFPSTNRYSTGSLVDETPPAPPTAPPAGTDAPPPAAPAQPAATTPVSGSRITMKDFAAKHRARTTKYKHKIVQVTGCCGK
jgi:proteasome lid subunit RPN8/RPN11